MYWTYMEVDVGYIRSLLLRLKSYNADMRAYAVYNAQASPTTTKGDSD